jgi:hypothetical protein
MYIKDYFRYTSNDTLDIHQKGLLIYIKQKISRGIFAYFPSLNPIFAPSY